MISAFIDYINASLGKGTIGAYISVGIFAIVALNLVLGIYFGALRGFSKSVIRLFTVLASAICSLYGVKTILRIIVENAPTYTENGSLSVEELLTGYFPQVVDAMPDMVKPMLAELNSGVATVFIMMVVAIIASPVLFIAFFTILKFLTFFLYKLLAGLAGAISYGKGWISTLLGAVVGLAQGVVIAAVIVFPISGLCGIATNARAPLIEKSTSPNEYIEMAYTTVIDDLADNPLFVYVDQYGGEAIYTDLITIKINGEQMYMGDRCIGAIKLIGDAMPIVSPDFKWNNPTEEQRQAFENVVADVGDDELIAELMADIVRGIAVSYKKGGMDLGLSGATKQLMDDVMSMFLTSTKETVEGDLDVVVDIYLIMCDRHVLDSFSQGNHFDMRELLTDKDENGNTTSSVILKRLNEYDRATHIVTSFTKISLALMHGSQEFGQESEELYQSVKENITTVLTHNKSDFESEEAYREAVSNDLDKAFADNNIRIEENVKQDMIDYIANNYGDYNGEITDAEVNDALLSYYESYANSKLNGGDTEDGEDTPDEGEGDIELPPADIEGTPDDGEDTPDEGEGTPDEGADNE